jgi:hypothetical protein
MNRLFPKTCIRALSLFAALALLPLQASQAQEVTISAEAAALIASGDVAAAKKILIEAGVNVNDHLNVNAITAAILQSIISESSTTQLESTVKTAVASLTEAVIELSTDQGLNEEQTVVAVEATAQGAVTAVITAPEISQSALTGVIAASSNGATSGAMQGASNAGSDVTAAAEAATQGSVAAVAVMVEQDRELTVVAQAVQAAASGSSQAAIATSAELNIDPGTVVVAVATSAEEGADSIPGDIGVATVINEAVETGVQQGTLSGANEAGITGEAAEDLASVASEAAEEAASDDYSGGDDTDTPDPVTTDETVDETEIPSNSTEATPATPK